MLKMNKKGTYLLTKEVIYFIFRVAVLGLISLVVIIVVANYIDRDVEVEEFQSFVFSSRLFTEDCFGYNDGLRLKYGVLDSSKINEERVRECLKYDKEFLGAKINVFNQEIYYNKEFYDSNVDSCDNTDKVDCSNNVVYVLDQNYNSGKLEVEVVNID